jgi:hypothetical protein
MPIREQPNRISPQRTITLSDKADRIVERLMAGNPGRYPSRSATISMVVEAWHKFNEMMGSHGAE